MRSREALTRRHATLHARLASGGFVTKSFDVFRSRILPRSLNPVEACQAPAAALCALDFSSLAIAAPAAALAADVVYGALPKACVDISVHVGVPINVQYPGES